LRQEGGQDAPCGRRNRRVEVTVTVVSGEPLHRPGGVSGTGGKGEKERRGRATYRHWEESKRARIKAGLSEGLLRPFPVRSNRLRLKVGDDVWAPPVSEREGRQRIPVRGLLVGLRVVSSAGPNRFPGSSYIFISSFSFFPFSVFLFLF
jgi:hypothetical protein